MFRVLLVLAAIPLGLLLLGNPTMRTLVSDSVGSSLGSPAIAVLSAPAQVYLDEPDVMKVRAAAPAEPGDPIVLDTAGTYGMGYYQVDQGVLDDNLEATFTIPARHFLGTYKYWARIAATATYQEGKSATVPVKVIASTEALHPTCGGEEPVKPNGDPWVCTYDDEFSGDSLNRRFWTTQTGGSTTGTASTYACPMDSPDTVAVKDGNLELSLVELPAERACNSSKSSKFAYGQVMHYQSYSQTYGKYEIRALIPDVQASGSQQSFWLWPKSSAYGGWPASGEIDFAELYSSTPGMDKPYIHYLPGETQGGTNKNVTNADCAIKPGEWNTFGVEWRPKQIIVLLNSEVCFIDDYSSIAAGIQGKNSPFDKPFYLAMNQAMGSIGNDYDPALVPDKVTTLIDYVRIWK